MIKLCPDGTQEERTLRIKPTPGFNPISPEAEAVHGISMNDLKDKPIFAEVADEILAFFSDYDIAGFNSDKFDIPLLAEEMLRVGRHLDLRNRHIVDVQAIFHKMERRDLTAAYKFYCGKDLNNAHAANADTRATLEILDAQVARYKNVEYEVNGNVTCPITSNVKDLDVFSHVSRNVDLAGRIVLDDNDVEVFAFGKHKGKSVIEVFKYEPSFYFWMKNNDFPLETKSIIDILYQRADFERKEEAKAAKMKELQAKFNGAK